MLILTSPSALLALLGLLVPLAIHLWNRRPGREVAVGSLRWLAAGANRRLRNLRLEQLGLLLLRALLLAGLAVAVAGPVWRQPQPASQGQVLISPELAGTSALAAMRPVIDSLRRQGYALRWLRQGLPLLPAAAWQPATAKKQPTLADSAAFYEARIWQAADSFPGQPLYVLTPARLAAMQGTRHQLPAGLTWRWLPLAADETWLQAAMATGDSLHLLVGHSTERQTTFRKVRVAQPQLNHLLIEPTLPASRYTLTKNYQPQLQPVLTVADSGRVPVQPASLRVWVYASPTYAADARYLRAALQAASIGLPIRFSLTVAPTLPDTVYAPDWLFWLSSAPVPAAWRNSVRRGLHLWQSPPGAGTPDTTLLVAPELLADAPATLWRHAQLPPAADAEIVWADAQGRAVLARQAIGRGAVYRAATRLHPAWSTLPANAALPALLLGVLRPALHGPELARFWAHDQRRLDLAQLPTRRQVAGGRPLARFRLLDLRPWLVLAVALLLALERRLARRTRFYATSPV